MSFAVNVTHTVLYHWTCGSCDQVGDPTSEHEAQKGADAHAEYHAALWALQNEAWERQLPAPEFLPLDCGCPGDRHGAHAVSCLPAARLVSTEALAERILTRLEQETEPWEADVVALAERLAGRTFTPVEYDTDEPCPNDPDGVHHVGCGCDP